MSVLEISVGIEHVYQGDRAALCIYLMGSEVASWKCSIRRLAEMATVLRIKYRQGWRLCGENHRRGEEIAVKHVSWLYCG